MKELIFMVTKSQDKGKTLFSTPVVILLAVVALGLAGYLYWINTTTTTTDTDLTVPTGSPKPTPTPTPTKLIDGSDTYYISRAAGAPGPNVTTLTLDPLDPKQKQHQTLTAHVIFDTPVTSVTITFESDHKTRDLPPFTLKSGTNTNGDWQTSWDVDDTILYRYFMTVTAVSGNQKSKTSVGPRT